MRFSVLILTLTVLMVKSSYAQNYQTIGHRILEIEAETLDTPDVATELNRLIFAAESKIKAENLIDIPDEEERAEKIFESITQTLRDNSYTHRPGIFPGTLSEVLSSPSRLFDCDTGSFIFLSVADVLDLPISMVEVESDGSDLFTDHNFVRWTLANGNTVDWDPNGEYRRYWDQQTPLYGFAWSEAQLLGYVYYVRGISWGKKGDYLRAIEDYERAIVLFPEAAKARNNLSWDLSTKNSVQNLGRQSEALELALQAVELHPTPSHKDTLACAFAINNFFRKAIDVQSKIVQDDADPEFRKRLEKFKKKQNCLGEQ